MKASAPAIVGSNMSSRNAGTFSGAIYVTNNPSQPRYQGGSSTYQVTSAFDASRCSGIYGASVTITPLSQTCRLSIKY